MSELRSVPSKILKMMPFVPAEDYELSKRFYRDLGFHENWGDDQICELVGTHPKGRADDQI
jgi:hypothetical protein